MNALRLFVLHPAVRFICIGQFLLAIAIFFYAALAPFDDTPGKLPDWAYHLIGNVLLLGSAYAALLHLLSLNKIFLLSLTLSMLAEASQSLTASRMSDPKDVATNIAGLLMCYAVCFALNRILGLHQHHAKAA